MPILYCYRDMRLLSKTLDVIWCNWGFNDAITVKGCDFLNSSDRSAGSNAHLHPLYPHIYGGLTAPKSGINNLNKYIHTVNFI